jgi:hypothetical protein
MDGYAECIMRSEESVGCAMACVAFVLDGVVVVVDEGASAVAA